MIPPTADVWNYMLVAGKRTPGVVRLSGNDLKIGWDKQQATATSGGWTKRINEPIKEFDAEFNLCDEVNAEGRSDFDDWDPFEATLKAAVAPKKKPYALDVSHPDLARVGITAVTVETVGGMVLDGKGGATCRVHFIEYRPPKPITAVTLTKTAGDKLIENDLATIKQLQDDFKP